MNKVKVIGCGGIGTWLLSPLCQYLNYTVRDGCEVSLIDGDTYEDRNRERQVFSVNGPKADVTAERLRQQYPGIYFWPHPVYLTEDNVVLMIRDGDVVFSCVDNHATRKLLSERCEELDNITLISGGNDFTDGNIQVYVKRDGKEQTLPITNKYHPEIAKPADKNPADEPAVQHQGCGVIVESSPQLIFTNNSIAAKMLECYYAVMMGQLKYDEVFVDILSGAAKPKVLSTSPMHRLQAEAHAKIQAAINNESPTA